MSGSLLARRAGRVLVLVVDRPRVRNALDPETLHALADEIDAASSDDSLGAVVLTGAGTVCFTAGMDLRAVRDRPEEVGPAVRRFDACLGSARRPPIVAAVRGMAVGGGFEIMLRCDLSVVSHDARFVLPEVARGLVPGGGATLLPARIPIAVALELGLLGEPIDARRALELGLVNRVCDSADVVATAIALAARLAEQPPVTLRRTRELMWITAREGAAANEAASAEPPGERQRAEAAAGVARFLAGRAHSNLEA